MNLIVVDNYEQLSIEAAKLVEDTIVRKPDASLCFPTGNTPLGLYRQLTARNKVDMWKQVTIVGLDEYLGVRPYEPISLMGWLDREFLSRAGIPKERLLQIDPVHPEPFLACADFDRQISAMGSIDVTVLGLGPNGHVGFNEPGTTPDMPSRVVRLTEESRQSNAAYWKEHGIDVPGYGLTMGLKTIIEQSRSIVLLVSGAHKADILHRFLTETESPSLPASYLRKLDSLTVIADTAAAGRENK